MRRQRNYRLKDHCITLEGEQLYFTVNGCKQKAEDVKFIEPERLKTMCDEARDALENGAPLIRLDGSISTPWKTPRPFEVLPRGTIRNLERPIIMETRHAKG